MAILILWSLFDFGPHIFTRFIVRKILDFSMSLHHLSPKSKQELLDFNTLKFFYKSLWGVLGCIIWVGLNFEGNGHVTDSTRLLIRLSMSTQTLESWVGFRLAS